MLNIYEIYPTIEGETTRAGWPCAFVRLAGCNLKCRWCDTRYANEGGSSIETATLLERIKSFGFPRVVVTGGEPLLQGECLGLITQLADTGYEVFVETNGSLDISPVDDRAIVRMDLKPPSSGETERMNWDNIPHLEPKDEVKIVIADAADYSWAVDKINEYSLPDLCSVNLTPELGSMQPHILSKWIVDDRLNVRLNLQMHKIIWGTGARGV